MVHKNGKAHFDWEDVERSLYKVIDQLDPSITYDTILGLARGGTIPAAMLAYKLDCHNLHQLGVRTRTVDDIQYYGTPQLTGNVLVVDDINDSGLTFSAVEKYIKSHPQTTELGTVTFASLIKRHTTEFKIDVTGHEANNDSWYVFPWD